jgi:cytochrome b subunit of formate dehydrogenase
MRLRVLLMKANRISCWLLLFLMIVFIITGYSMTGKFGFNKLIDKRSSTTIHLLLDIPLIILFLFHSFVSIYFAFLRWGWIRK